MRLLYHFRLEQRFDIPKNLRQLLKFYNPGSVISTLLETTWFYTKLIFHQSFGLILIQPTQHFTIPINNQRQIIDLSEEISIFD